MIGMLLSDEADIAAAALGRTLERDKVATFGKTLMEAEYTLIAPRKTSAVINISVYIDIMTKNAWAFCFVLIILIAITFTTINASGTNNLHTSYDSESFSYINGIAVALMFMMQQNYTLSLRSISSKILYLTVGLCTYVIFALYSADLTTMMTVGSHEPSIKSFSDVIKYDFNVMTHKATSWHGILKKSLPGTAMSQVYNEKMDGNPNSILVGKSTDESTEMLFKREKTLLFASSMSVVTLGKGNRLQSLDIQGFIYYGYELQNLLDSICRCQFFL